MALIEQNYRDQGNLREQDAIDLERYLLLKDRAPLTGRGVPFFSGREAEISAFREMANGLSLGDGANATIVAEGPPGAGKSALMCQFMEEMRSLPPTETGRRRWLPVPLSAESAESPSHVADAIDKAIITCLARDLLATEGAARPPGEAATSVERLSEYWGRLDAAGAKAKAREFFDRGGSVLGFSLGVSRQGPPTSINEAAERRSNAWQRWQIVLMIDEAQGIAPGKPHEGKGTLSALHQGLIKAPVSFCAFGLPGTLVALADVNVSRLMDGRTIRLGGLEAAAAKQTVKRCFNAFAVDGGGPWQEAVLKRAANWPQHLAIYLNAAIRQIHEASPDRMDAGTADIKAAMRLGDRGRARYCRQRVARIRRHHGGFEKLARELVPSLRERGGWLPYSDLFDLVEEVGLRTSTLSGASATQFIQDAELSGFLALDAEEASYSMPIPSFAGHLLSEPLPE
ncbi:MAG: hypothetical protein OXF68_11010 [Gammaproteobacteria bacterium]|nr:hypothetical protein [Gammaproteobacteria bacterium]MCY4344162.1 hypothetical protein [Gammaproteobacteria bacterium]